MIRFLQSGNRAVKFILSAFLLIICVSMVWYLVPGLTGSNTNASGVLATVGGESIQTDQVSKLANNLLQQKRVPEQFRSLMFPQAVQAASQQLFQEAELRYEANRLGLTVSDQELRDELRNGSAGPVLFPGGQWIGQEKYQELLTENGTTVEAFEQQTKMQLLSRKLLVTIVAAVDASPSEIEKLYKEQNTKVKFDYAVLKEEDLAKAIKPTDTELKAYFEAHQASYQNSIAEKRQIRYFVIPDKDLQSKVTVTPADVQKYYSEHQEQYRSPEQVKTRHILISTPTPGTDGKVDQKAVDAARAKAEDVLKQVRAGGDFAALANKYSEDPGNTNAAGVKQGGELPLFKKGPPLDPEFEKVAFGQNKGQISDLVRSSFGFHIIQTEDKLAAGITPLAQVQSKIETGLRGQKTSALVNQVANDAQSAAKAQGLDKVATKYNASVVQSNPVAQADTLPGIGASKELMGEAFSVPEGSGPQAARFAQGTVIFEVTKIEPARTPSLDEIRDRVTTDFKAERARMMLQQKVQELADHAHTEHDLRKAAKEAGATVETTIMVGRNDSVQGIGSMSGPASVAFGLKPGEISGPISTGPAGIVIAVTERQDPSTTDPQFAKARDQIRDQIISEKRNQAVELFISNLETRLEKEGKKKINKTEMDKLTRTRT